MIDKIASKNGSPQTSKGKRGSKNKRPQTAAHRATQRLFSSKGRNALDEKKESDA